jgi:predicted regulator of Ras-like GTPase activity (Roadblock/LC7/MglB family)
MYRLTIRRQWFLFVGSLLLFLGLVIFLPSHSPDKVGKLSLLLVLFTEILLSFGFAYLFYQSAPLPQVIKAAATFLAVATGIGTIGNLTSQVNQPLPGTDVLISWIQLFIMNIGGGIATVALYEVQTGPGYRTMQDAAADIVRTVKPRASVSATKLPAMPDPLHVTTNPDQPQLSSPAPQLPQVPQVPPTPQPSKDLSVGRQTMPTPVSLPAVPLPPAEGAQAAQSAAAAIPEMPLAKANEPASAGSAPATGSVTSTPTGDQSKRGMTITSQRIQVQSKRKPSTFTKLQALSQSGRSLTAPAGSGLEAEGLKSILDRLEDQVESASTSTSEPVRQPVAQAAPQPQESKAPHETVAKVSQPPAAVEPEPTQATPPKGSSIASRLVGVVTKNRMPAAQKHSFKFDPEPEAAESGASVPSPPDKQEAITIPAAGSFDSAVSAAQPPQAAGASEVGAFAPAQTSEHSPEAPQGFAPSQEKAGYEAGEASLPKSNIFETGVDDEMDQLFSKLASPEVQREFTSGSHAPVQIEAEAEGQAPLETGATVDFVMGSQDAEAQTSAAALEYPGEEVAQTPGFAEPESTQEHLFGPEVDNEIDEIFSNLAPPEAQREVVHPVEEAEAAVAEEEAEVAIEEDEPVAHEVFEPASHEDFEPAIHEEVEPVAHEDFEPVAHAEVEAASHEAFEQEGAATSQEAAAGAVHEGLFGEEVNEEIDDIFANLAPPEAQLNVSDRGAGKGQQVGQAGPAAQEVKSAPQTSFAPPPQPEPVAARASGSEPKAPVAPVEELAEEEAFETPIVNPVTKNIEVREFGRLSSKSAVAKGQQSTTGTMKTIGKLLIDVQAIENIIKVGETGKVGSGLASARIITAQRGEGIKALLGKIDSYQGVTGCLIVGHDGLVIASTIASGEDKDALGALSSALLNTSNLATLKLEIGKLKQMVLLTDYANGQGHKEITTVLTDVDVGVLAVFLDTQQLDKLDGLLETIHSTIHG